ncbi:MAG TPA: sugar phosphate isomerase/epimerase family protein [Pirellulaceae bacterium]
MHHTERWPLGIFASLDEGLGARLEMVRELGVPTLHLHAPSAGLRTPQKTDEFKRHLLDLGLTVTAVFGGFAGESYADIPTARATVGLVPESTRSDRLREMREIADFAATLGCSVAALHLGFIPESHTDPAFAALVEITGDLCDYCAARSQAVHLETGQETADELEQFLYAVNRDNLFVNFDPANMILYGTGEPIPALRQVGRFVRSVHCKDAQWAARPGHEWGTEVALGRGDVDWDAFLKTLDEIGYRGPLTIEREIPQVPDQQRREIQHAVDWLTSRRQPY